MESREMKKRKKLLGVTVLAAAAVFCAACSDHDQKETPDQKSPAVENQQPDGEDGQKGYDVQSIKAHLQELPPDAYELEKQGCFVMTAQELFGRKEWERFYEHAEKGIADELVIVRYTPEGDPVFLHLSYDGEKFRYLEDASRDEFTNQAETYRDGIFSYLKVFETVLAETGDRSVMAMLTNDETLTREKWEEIMASSQYNEQNERDNYYFASWCQGNTNAELTGEEAWHQLETSFDESELLIPAEKIGALELVSVTGERLRLNEQEDAQAFREIVGLYENLDVEPSENLSLREGYTCCLKLYDADGQFLQAVVPYKDALKLDYTMYKATANGTAIELLIKLQELCR